LLEHARRLPILDLGCGDGDLAFLFESLGFAATAVDYELTNFNQMQGIRSLKDALGSQVEIHSVDLDGRVDVPGGPFGLCLLLGLLYHVKNPFYLLEYVAQKADYCLLSTRIARRTPQGTDISGEALAYLVDFEELNRDRTNFWIFSPEGLRRLITRAGWTICQFESTGHTGNSDPTNSDRDERVWYLLRSRKRVGSRAFLDSGWYDLEEGTYRWTEPAFSATLVESARRGAKLEFRFTSAHSMALSVAAGSVELPTLAYSNPGVHVYSAALPEGFSGQLRFGVEPGLRSPGDARDLGVLVSFWREGLETTDDNVPIEIVY
jgi:SAM-dependent methyltransferase